jgi:hypothetical protein
MKGSGSAYNAARNYGVLDEVCKHMKTVTKPHGWWLDKKHVLEEAKKYRNRRSFKIGASGAYKSAWNNGWLDEIPHFIKKINKIISSIKKLGV